MRILSLDTTSVPGSAAFLRPGRPAVLSAPGDPRPFGERLPAWLLNVLCDAGATVADVDLLVVGAGPGSLTGLRVGIATIQGLSFATGRPVVAVSALEALAYSALEVAAVAEGDVVAAWSNARRGEVFAEPYEVRPGVELASVRAPQVGVPEEVAASWTPFLAGRRLVLVGDLTAGAEPLFATASSIVTVPAPPLAPVMATIGARRARHGEAGPPHAIRPIYVRRPDAEVARDRRAGGGRG